MVRYTTLLKALFALAGALLASWPGSVSGASQSVFPSTAASSPLLRLVAKGQCVMLGRQSGRELLVNTCKTCGIVKVTRKRPGSNPAIHREYPVPAKSKTELSFRGPGQTRLVSDAPCFDEEKAAEEDSGAKKCTQLQRRIDGGLVVINTCNGCRQVVTERLGPGGFKDKQTLTIAGLAYVPVKSKGASTAKILSEKKCR